MELEPADEIIATAIVENTVNKSGFYAEHGLSILLEIAAGDTKTKILMDTGQSTFTFMHNVQRLKIELADIDAIVISHGHYDHTGALLDILQKIPKKIPVIGHPKVFDEKYSTYPRLRYIGVPFSKDDIMRVGVLKLNKNPVKVAASACTTGEINRNSSPPSSNKLVVKRNETLVKDKLLDDQALVVNTEKGLVIISGCAHSGIINTIFHAQRLTNQKNVFGVIGGFHLRESAPEVIDETLDVLKTLNPLGILAPCHCTGFRAQKVFADNLEGFKLFNTTTTLKF